MTTLIFFSVFLNVRLSQDLAKDLAILAREIHDVAGEGEAQTPEAESNKQVHHMCSTLTLNFFAL